MVMDGKKHKIITLITLVAFLATLLIVPTATAQNAACMAGGVSNSNMKLLVKGDTKNEALIAPITGKADFEVTNTFKWDTAAVTVTQVPITYTASTNQGGWASVVLSSQSSTVTVAPDDNDKTVTDVLTGTVFLDKNAPAFGQVKVLITATSPGGMCVNAPDDANGELPLVAGFYGKMVARFEKTIENAGQNAKVTLPLVIENYGNGDIEVSFELLDAKETKLDVVRPSPVIVPTAIGSTQENIKQINVDIKTPFKNGYMNQPATVDLKLTSISTEKRDIIGGEAQVSALIQTQGVYVPGFELTTLLGAALAAALALVRRR